MVFMKRHPLLLIVLLMFLLVARVEAFDFEELEYLANNKTSSIESAYILLLPERSYPNEWGKKEPAFLVASHYDLRHYPRLIVGEPLSLNIRGFDDWSQIRGIFEANKGIDKKDYYESKEVIYWHTDDNLDQENLYKLKIDHYNNSGSYDGVYRTFQYRLEPEDQINEVKIDVFLPAGASDYFFSDEIYSHKHINGGEAVYSFIYSDVSRNKPVDITIKYKLDDSLYLNYGMGNYEKTNMYNIIPSIIFALVLLILGLAVVLFSGKSKDESNQLDSDFESYDRKDLIDMLIDGEISEHTYENIIDDKYQ